MSKRISYSEYGGPEILRFDDEEVGAPGPGQVRIRQEMIGVNPVDWKMVAGYFRHTDRAPFPHVPGWASTGIVDAVGPGVTGTRVGDAVIVGARGNDDDASARIQQLTARERDLLACVGRGLTNEEIADELYLSSATTRTYVSRMLAKLDCRDRVALVILAHQSGILD